MEFLPHKQKMCVPYLPTLLGLFASWWY